MKRLLAILGLGLLCMGCNAQEKDAREEPELTHRFNLPEGEHGYTIRWADGTRCIVVYGAFDRPNGVSCDWRKSDWMHDGVEWKLQEK